MARPFITLNAAVTWLAFGQERGPSEELELRRVDQHKIVELIDVCFAEALDSDCCAAFPRALPYWPLRALVDCLNRHRQHWPLSANKLRALAVHLKEKWRSYDDEYGQALGRIMEAAQGGQLELLGQISEQAGAEVRVIPPANLLGGVTIDHLRTDLGPDVTARDRPRPFAILKSGSGLQPIFHNVVVSLERLRKSFQATNRAEGGGPVRRENPKPEELGDWYRANKSYLETLGEAAQTNELRKAFVIKKDARQLLRSIKRDNDDLRPERGRPKRAGPKSRA